MIPTPAPTHATMLNPRLFSLPLWEIKQYGCENLTYGSLTKKGLKTIAAELEGLDIRGFDLGCGDGELIYHLQNMLPESIWEGVEISEYRVSMQTRDVSIWQGDMLEENFRIYTVLHADNLCLDEMTAERLEEKIAREFRGIYITYRWPKNLDFLRSSIHRKTVLTETTWTTHPIHFFEL